MAVVACFQQVGTFTGSSGDLGADSSSITYGVRVDSTMDVYDVITGAQAFGSTPVPAWGAPLRTDTPLVARRFTASETDYHHWQVVVDYEPFDPLQENETPENRPAELSWSYIEYEEAPDLTYEGFPYLNSAGDPFDQPPKVIRPGLVLNVKQYQTSFDPALFMDYVGCVNSAVFFGAAPNTLKFKPGGSTREYVDGAFYFSVSYQFEYRPDGWQPIKILDRGPRYLVAGALVISTDDNGVATGKPVLLDGQGGKLAVGADPVFLEFEPFAKKDLNALLIRPPVNAQLPAAMRNRAQ